MIDFRWFSIIFYPLSFSSGWSAWQVFFQNGKTAPSFSGQNGSKLLLGAGCFTKLSLELSYDVTPPESQDMKVKAFRGFRGWSLSPPVVSERGRLHHLKPPGYGISMGEIMIHHRACRVWGYPRFRQTQLYSFLFHHLMCSTNLHQFGTGMSISKCRDIHHGVELMPKVCLIPGF